MSIELEKAGLDRFQRIMTIAKTNPTNCEESDRIIDVADKILKSGHRRLPVLNKKEEIVGMVALMDVLGAYLRKINFKDKISLIMSRDVIFSNSDETLEFVLQRFKLSRRGGFPVLSERKLVGMITERDIVDKFYNVKFDVKVEELMTKKPFHTTPHITIMSCLRAMINTKYRRFPVVDGTKLIGMETGTDILKHLKANNFSDSCLMKTVDSVMIKPVSFITEGKDVSEAIKTMKLENIGGLPVVDENKNLKGFITGRDVLEEIV